jgi:oxaloacetate decarboxylase gamma subunit
MTIMEMFGQSGILTVLGMGVVFSFLFIMVVCVTLMGKIVNKLGLEKDVQKSLSSAPAQAAGASHGVTAAISAAVTEYQKNNRG